MELPPTLDPRIREVDKEVKTSSPSSEARSQWATLSSLAWDISYSIVTAPRRRRLWERQAPTPVKILHSVAGYAEGGDLIAVMGASGCGKSTLLSCLALRDQTFQGGIYMNDKRVDGAYLSLVGFVDQHDVFLPALTVREHLEFNSMVRLGGRLDEKAKLRRVDEVMKQMNLTEVGNTMIGGGKSMIRGLSHGERKRLSFATELLPDPSIVIADEPTTGLDSLMALTVCRTLRGLADTNRLVICSIHQPSSKVFDLFTHVLLMAAGRVAYFGPTTALVGYLDSVGLRCPEYHNAAEFAVRCLASTQEEEEAVAAKLGGEQAGGDEARAVPRVLALCQQYEQSAQAAANRAWKSRVKADDAAAAKPQVFTREYSTSIMTQFNCTVVRTFLTSMRDTLMLSTKIGVGIGMGVVIGLGYRRPSSVVTQAAVTDLSGLMFLTVVSLLITSFFLVAYTLPSELHVFLRERIAGVNRIGTFLVGHAVSNLPLLFVWSALYSLLVYLIAVPDVTAERLGWFVGLITLGNLTSTALGYCVSALTMNEMVAFALVPTLSMPQLLFAGVVVKVSTIPAFLRWLQWTSIVKYLFQALMVKEFDGRSVTCASGEICLYHSTEDVFNSLEIRTSEFGRNCLILGGLAVVYMVIGYLGLVRRCRHASVR